MVTKNKTNQKLGKFEEFFFFMKNQKSSCYVKKEKLKNFSFLNIVSSTSTCFVIKKLQLTQNLKKVCLLVSIFFTPSDYKRDPPYLQYVYLYHGSPYIGNIFDL